MAFNSWLRADTHVHFYDCFDEQAFLHAAVKNLCHRSNDAARATGVLLLAETSSSDWFTGLQVGDSIERLRHQGWSIRNTDEETSLILESTGGDRLVIIAGRQIVCAERVEVLALGLVDRYDDGAPIVRVLTDVDNAGALPTVAWGVGKWTGARHAIVQGILEDPPCLIAVGDIGGRLAAMPRPKLFEVASSNGISILPGTDLLPFERNSDRVGTYGVEWQGDIDELNPGNQILNVLRSGMSQAKVFGHLAGVIDFVRDQVAIQIKNRRQ